MTEIASAAATTITNADFHGKPIRLALDQDHLVLNLNDLCEAVGAKIPTAEAIDADVGDLYVLDAVDCTMTVVTRYIASVIANTCDSAIAKSFKSWLETITKGASATAIAA